MTSKSNQYLVARWDQGDTVEQLSNVSGRTPTSIAHMLVSSGIYATRREVISANKERGGNTIIKLETDNGYCIYLIKNPHNLKPVYIGQTQNLKKRKRAHARRFKKVFSGEHPIIEVLCYADTYDEARQLEKEKIAEYHWLGYDLLNIEDRELC